MVTEIELREKLTALINGDVSLDAFEDWFTVASWNAHQDSSAAAQRLVGAIELRLGEYSNGHLSAAELNRELEALVLVEPIHVSHSLNIDIPILQQPHVMPEGLLDPPVVAGSSSVYLRRLVPVSL